MINTQKFYEGIEIEGKLSGLITYMRTNSYRFLLLFMQTTQEFIKNKYVQKYVKLYYKHKNNNSQNSH
ncbi:hypothetical protein [Candidatus Phytoplasma phoenicium]|uniref:hypothetical protein n=1 Tax=Candidatus Phytoplasma phoenicium TaxID=198422 RepID=UPI000ACF727C